MENPLTELDRDELTRRIKAARELRNVTQAQLAAKFVEDGLDRHELGKLERGDPDFPLMRARLDALARHLRVPERWFTSADTDLVVGLAAEEQLNDEQRQLVIRAAQLLAEAGQASALVEPQRPPASGGQGRPGGQGA